MKKISLILSISAFILVPYFANAEPILRNSESISVDSSQSLEGDFYGLAQKISISGKATNDVYLGGVNVTLNAPIQEDLTVLGGTVQIHSEVGDDVRMLGGDMTIGERVGGDVVVYGGVLHVLSTAHIEGDLIYYGEDLRVEGNVDGSVHGFSQKARIDSTIGGDVDYSVVEPLSLGENAEILGSLSYESFNTFARAEKSIVQGEINRQDPSKEQASDFFETYLFVLGVLVFAALALYLIARKSIQRFTVSSTSMLGQNGLIGLAILILVPFVSMILMVSVVGIFAGLMLLFIYIAAIIASIVLAGIIFGLYIQKVLTKKTTVGIQTIVIGSIASSVLVFVPYVGGLVVFAASMVALGNMSRQAYKTLSS